jgi:hypothetical protein
MLHLIAAISPALVASHAQHNIELANEITEYDCAVARHGAVFLVKLDGLRIMAGQNWWVLHNTAAVSAQKKRAARVFRFEYSEHYLAIQRIGSSDLSA